MNKNTDLRDIGPKDFEFINMAGKQASVPQGFKWNHRQFFAVVFGELIRL